MSEDFTLKIILMYKEAKEQSEHHGTRPVDVLENMMDGQPPGLEQRKRQEDVRVLKRLAIKGLTEHFPDLQEKRKKKEIAREEYEKRKSAFAEMMEARETFQRETQDLEKSAEETLEKIMENSNFS